MTRSPATFSCRSALTAETFSRASVYARDDLTRNSTVASATSGTRVSTVSPSLRLMISSAIITPTKDSPELTMVISPVCRNDDSASTSVVIRVMIRPDISRS